VAKFSEIIDSLIEGKEVRRNGWDESWHIYMNLIGDICWREGHSFKLTSDFLTATDWEVIKEKKEEWITEEMVGCVAELKDGSLELLTSFNKVDGLVGTVVKTYNLDGTDINGDQLKDIVFINK